MEAYLDNAATTRTFASVRDIMVKTMDDDFGNPSSLHAKGVGAEKYVREAREIIAGSLKVAPKEIFFTSGGTESNNQALIGTAMANQRAGRHIISTNFEHASVYNTLGFLEDMGFEVTYVPVDSLGRVRMDEFLAAIREDTILISIMMVNNELGSVQDIPALSKAAKEKKRKLKAASGKPNVSQSLIFHVDGIQAYGKYYIYPKRMGIDLLSVSAHKIHGPKGIGFLYIDEKVKIKPLIYGGGQQKGMRSGTENVPGIAGMGQAVKEMYAGHEDKINRLYDLKSRFIEGVGKLTGTTVNAVGEDVRQTAPHVISVSFEGVRSEVLLHALEERGVYVSSGSACSSNHPSLSGTLHAIGVKKELLDSTLRFSLSVFNTEEEIDYALAVLSELLPVLRRFTRH
ncbi:cysteine desulfurase family protein [Anaerolentibacter hominis]|uniref:cysteine desulfurase family protein n=1 Tax=Anaerolentibacter hominis TaxID=3079009 RepID=UPI0031B8325D